MVGDAGPVLALAEELADLPEAQVSIVPPEEDLPIGMKELQPAIDLGVEIIKSFVLAGINNTMNQYNKLGKK